MAFTSNQVRTASAQLSKLVIFAGRQSFRVFASNEIPTTID
jgi:hypothetical protein